MSKIRRYLAEIGARGGRKSRRKLDPETAREMVRVREAKRAERLAARAPAPRVVSARVVSLHSAEASEPPRLEGISERLALLATLSTQSWRLTGHPLPNEARASMRVTFRPLRAHPKRGAI
jgi:hypothetical protein